MSDKIREATLEAIEKKWTEAARLGCIDAFPSALNEAWQSALAQQPTPAVPEGWTDAYAAFKGAFDNPAARRKMDDEYAQDARRRMREINDAMLAAATPAAEQSECGCCGQTGPCDIDCDCAEQPDTVKVPRELLACAARSCANGWVDYPTAKELRALLGKESEDHE